MGLLLLFDNKLLKVQTCFLFLKGEFIGVTHWLIKLRRFQVYNSIMHRLQVVLSVHHPKSSFLASPFIPPSLPPPLSSGNHHTVVCVDTFSVLISKMGNKDRSEPYQQKLFGVRNCVRS